MKKKALAIAVASALVAPASYAASDTSGMRYTSASEGFYGSLRARYVTPGGGAKDNGADLESGSSRIGVRGTHDLGGGLTGFYQWELGVALDDDSGNSGLDQRLGNVGLRGDFGEIALGSFWTYDYGATHGATDQANTHSGYNNYSVDREGRSERAVQYTTPDFNGFQAALLFKFDNSGAATAGTPTFCRNNTAVVEVADGGSCATGQSTIVQGKAPKAKDANDLDAWNLSAQYAVQGFTVGGSYNVIPDGRTKTAYNASHAAVTSKEDRSAWSLRGSYAQDNWNVNMWYGVDNTGDMGVQRQSEAAIAANTNPEMKADDVTYFEIHAGVAVNKVNLYAIHAVKENAGTASALSAFRGDGFKGDNTYTTLGVQYNFTGKSRTWLEYASQDYDSNPNVEDYVNIGLRFDF